MKLRYSLLFKKALKSLSKQNRNAAQRTLKNLEADNVPYSVKLRPLKSKTGLWIVNVTNKYRIVGRKDSGNIFVLLDVGSHDAIYNRWTR